LKLVILTSTSLRHCFFVNTIARCHEVKGVVREVKRDLVEESKGDQPQVLAEHLTERGEAERRYFAEHLEPACSDVLDVGVGGSNSPGVYDFLVARDPDAVLLFGTSIIEPPILSRFEGRIVNMHLGLSPYYRGTATNFWPLVNGQPECVGATIHHAIARVDAGSVLNQTRPELVGSDRAHDIGCKAIIAGVDGFLETLRASEQHGFDSGRSQPPGEGVVYRRRDYSAEAVLRMRANLDAGMVAAYLEKKWERDARYPLVTLGAG
jgi:methionyl-tRNA formyltransferase